MCASVALRSLSFVRCCTFEALLERVLIDLEDPDHTEAGKLDLVGEIANQMIGPAQQHFGDGLAILVPKTGIGNASRMLVEAKARGGSASPLLLPIRWEGHEAGLLVSIQRPEGCRSLWRFL